MRQPFFRWICLPFCLVSLLVLSGCGDEEAVERATSVRKAEVAPPVEAPPAELLASQRAFIEVSEKVTPTVVNIRAERVRDASRVHPLFEEFFGDLFRAPPTERRERSLGSGFILSEDGYILTNEHVVAGAEDIKVRLTDQRVFPGEVVGVDPKTDVAVLKIVPDDPLPMAVLGNSDRLRVGQWALAIGNPFGLDSTLTVGVISATGRANIGIEDYEDFIQTDASINPGNSGGPLLNIYGEVVGINTAIVASGQGIGFAIPINLASQIADQLITSGEVTRGWLGVGIQALDPGLAESFGLDRVTGALINKVLPETPAERAGLQRGDILLSFNGKEVRGVRELQLLVASTPIGSEVPVEVLRDGTAMTLQVEIAERRSEPRESIAGEPDDGWLGMQLQKAEKGLRVIAVEPGSIAAVSGVRNEDLLLAVNQQELESLQDLQRIRGELRPGRNVALLLQRGEAMLYLSLPIPRED
ncbi:MAG TPA: DegQ family serine endoprotease [Desulfuromonadales bacterium]|nr:DegQ family serine endoprotease [Desulfuromonadales bacterium]